MIRAGSSGHAAAVRAGRKALHSKKGARTLTFITLSQALAGYVASASAQFVPALIKHTERGCHQRKASPKRRKKSSGAVVLVDQKVQLAVRQLRCDERRKSLDLALQRYVARNGHGTMRIIRGRLQVPSRSLALAL